MRHPFRPQSILALSGVYSRWMAALGGLRARREYVGVYLRPSPEAKVLDLGCGPADILADLPPGVTYLGIDVSERYIQAARSRYGTRGRFLVQSVEAVALDEPGTYDLVMANGILHHLDDETALRLTRLAREALKPEGRFVTLDGCYHAGQGRLANLLLQLDRGRFVRRREEYVALASRVFADVTAHLRQDLLRVPYSHLIMCCRGAAAGEKSATGKRPSE
jgi:SAM-dependent methyltransferase